MGPRNPTVTNIKPLTGLRFIAAFHVVLFHLQATNGSLFASRHLTTVVGRGESAVSLFFVLSGFILHHVYLSEGKALNHRAFFVARFARIYPVYLLSLVLCVPLAWSAFHAGNDGTDAALKFTVSGIANSLLLQAWHPRLVYSWNLPGWSLSAEAFFYVCFPIIAVLLALFPKRQDRRTTWLVAAWLVVSGATVVLPLWLWQAWPGASSAVIKYNPLLRFPEFLLGALTGGLFAAIRAPRYDEGKKLPASAQLCLGVIIVALLGFDSGPGAWHSSSLASLFALLILSLALAPAAPIGKLLSAAPLLFLGGASYALYLVHAPILTYWDGFIADAQSGVLLTRVAPVVLCLAVSSAIFLYVEEPARTKLRQVLRSDRFWERAPATVGVAMAVGRSQAEIQREEGL